MLVEIIILLVILFLNSYFLYRVMFTKVYIDEVSKKIFGLMLLWVIAWVVTIFFTEIFYNQHPYNLWLSRLSFTSSSLIVLWYFFFSKSLSRDNRLIKWYEYSIIGIIVFLFVISVTDYVITDVYVVGNELVSIFGPFHTYWGFLLAVTFIYSIILNYITTSKEKNPTKRMQLTYIFWGSIISIVLTLITNLAIPALGLGEIRFLGPLSLIAFISLTYYAIIRYRFYSFRYIMEKSVYYTTIIIFTFIFIVGFEVFLTYLANTGGDISIVVYILIYSGIFVFSFVFFENYFNKEVTSFFYQNRVPHEQAENTLLTSLDVLNEPKDIFKTIEKNIKSVLGANSSVIFLDENIRELIEHKKFPDELYKGVQKLAKRNRKKRKRRNDEWYVIRDELVLMSKDYSDAIYKSYEVDFMIQNHIQGIFSLPLEKQNSAFLFINDKDEFSTFSIEDINYLKFVVSIAAVAIERSILFKRVSKFSEELQREVELATDDLNRKNLALQQLRMKERDMLDIMGHELRTPLTIIKMKQGVLRKLAEEKPQEFDVEKFLETDRSIKDAIEREVELLETMLSSTKIDSGRMEIVLEEVDLSNIIKATYDAYHNQAEAKGLKLKIEKYNEDLKVYADKIRLAEVVDNFVSNAIKYTEKGSVTVKVSEEDDMVKVSVVDTGIGISKKGLLRLGEKFYRVGQYIDASEDDTGKGNIVRPGGTGLGLYVAFQLVAMMGGKYDIDSEEGKGSTFMFTVPRYNGQRSKENYSPDKNVFERIGLTKKEKVDNKNKKKSPNTRSKKSRKK